MQRKSMGPRWVVLGLIAGCGVGSDRVAVGHNALGVERIETQRFERDADSIFELRGFGTGDEELALVRLRTGSIAESQNELGTEILISVTGQQVRGFTHETQRHMWSPFQSPAIQDFLELPAVSSALDREANIFIDPRRTDRDPERAYGWSCSPSSLLNPTDGPIAEQCCADWGSSSWYTMFVANGGRFSGSVSQRYMNPYGTGCRAADGVSGCSGDSCYYGPMGFARSNVWYVGGLGNTLITDQYGACSAAYASSYPAEFPNVYGTQSMTGCPGGGSTGAEWAY